jgi:hypothetical protein
MTKDFLPEYGQMPYGSRYRPLFKLFAGENWRFVRKDGQPVECDTATQAIDAARECVKTILNPVIRAEVIEPDAMLDEVAEWRQRKEAEAAEERARAFLGPETLFTKGRQVVVERRRAR